MFSLVLLRKLATHKAQIGLFFNYEVNKTYKKAIGKMSHLFRSIITWQKNSSAAEQKGGKLG